MLRTGSANCQHKGVERARGAAPAGRTAHQDMRSIESQTAITCIDPRAVGGISQQNRDFQGARDS